MNQLARGLHLATVLLLLAGDAVVAQDAGPVLQSSRWPPAAVKIADEFRFLDGARIRIGSAEADIMVAVNVSDDLVERFYWVQFEGYPDGSGLTYDYSSLPHADTIGGLVFRSGTRYGAYSESEISNERDTGTVVGMLREHGYDVPAPMMRIRMAAVDESGANELLIIYMESLAVTGLTREALDADPALWEEASEGLRQRAIAGLKLVDVISAEESVR